MGIRFCPFLASQCLPSRGKFSITVCPVLFACCSPNLLLHPSKSTSKFSLPSSCHQIPLALLYRLFLLLLFTELQLPEWEYHTSFKQTAHWNLSTSHLKNRWSFSVLYNHSSTLQSVNPKERFLNKRKSSLFFFSITFTNINF